MTEKQVDNVGVIIKQGNVVMIKWADGISQIDKVNMLHNLSMAEHEVLIRQKYFTQSNIIDPNTKKKVFVPKDGGTPN